MEEKILFDIQRFAEEITLTSGGVEETTIDNIKYTATSGTVTLNVDSKVVTVTGNVNISENIFQALAGYTFNINNAATINGITYSPAQIKFGENHWIVTLDRNCTVGNGSQSLGGLNISTDKQVTFNLHASDGEDSAVVNGTRYVSKSDGTVAIGSNSINLSGDVSLSRNLSGKTFTTGTDTVTFSVADDETVTIDGAVYTVTDAAVISVKNKNVTCAEGTLSIAPKGNTVTIGGIKYTAQNESDTIKLDDGNLALNGKFTVSIGAGQKVRLNKLTLFAEEDVLFTLDSDKNFVSQSGKLNIATSYGKSFKVNGVKVVDNGEAGYITLEDGNATLAGSYNVGDGDTSLSNKTFTIDGKNEIFFNAKSDTSNLKINDATFTATGKLEINTYFANSDAMKVDGAGVSIGGTGNFIFVDTDTVKINGISFKSDTAYSNIKANSTSEVTLNNVFTVGDGTQKLNGLVINSQSVIKGSTFNLGSNDNITIGGIDYSGSGTIKVDGADANSVTLTDYVEVKLDKGETIKINGTAYKAVDEGKITFDGTTVSFDEDISIESNVGENTYTFKENSSNSITVGGVKFSANSTDATVTIDTPAEDSEEKTKISINGTVTVELKGENLSITDYQFKVSQDSTAQINGINFTKTDSTSKDNDIIFTAENEVTLNSAFTVGDGTQKLNGLVVTLETSETSIFNLGGSDDSVTVKNYSPTGSSGDVEGDTETITGITYTGSGTVNVEGNNITLDGGITVTSTVDVSDYSFILTGGSSYTFGKTTINPASSSPVTISGISGNLTSDTVLDRNVKVGDFALGISNSAYTINLGSDNKVSSITTSGTGTFTIDGTAFNITAGTVTFNLDDNKISDVTSGNAKLTVGTYTTVIELTSTNNTLKEYPNGTWATSAPYDSYRIAGGTVYGVFNGTTSTEEEAAATAYSDCFTLSSGTVTLKDTATKSVKIEGEFTAIAGGKTYEIQSESSGTFNKDGITSLDSGTIYRTIDNGTFTYDGGTYTVDDSPVKFTVTSPPLSEDTSLTSGSGYSTVTTGNTFTLSGDTNTYTAQSGAKYIASGNSSGGYTAFSGTALYTLSGGTFTAETNKIYSISGNATYQLTSEGLETGGTSTELKTATGTRAFITEGTNKDSFTTDLNGDTYTATDGTYQLSITNGTEGTKSLKAGNATYTTSNGIFHYKNGNTVQTYTALSATTLTISLESDAAKALTAASGAGTRTAAGEKVTSTYDLSNTYTLASDAKKKISITNLNNSTEEFYNGSATRTTSSTFKVTDNTNTYTAYSGNAILTLTKADGGTESVKLTIGSGTREQSATTFEYNDTTYTNTATNGNITYSLKTNETSEKLFGAKGTRDYTDGNVTFNEDSYTTTGKYSFSLTNGTSSESLTASGTYSAGDGATFHFGGKTYQGFDGGATLTIDYTGTAPTALKTAIGKGTRILDDETFNHASADGNTYVVNKNSIIKLDITTKDNSTETFYDGTATQTYTAESDFHFKDKDYKAQDSATLTLTKSDGGSESVSLSGKGTRTDSETTFTVENIGTYTRTSDNITYQIADSDVEKVYSAVGKRTVSNETHSGDWKNEYTNVAGTRTLTVTNGASSDVLTTATATKTYTDGQSFNYGDSDTTYTATNYSATLKIDIANDKPTETFVSGSGKNSGGYIIKKSSAQIGDVVYTASADNVITVTAGSDNKITALSDTITGNFSNKSATIGGIVYSGTGNLKVNNINSVETSDGNFTATGDFSTARTINGNRTLNITGDTDVKATFSNGDVTKLENLNNGATVVNAGGAVTAIADENGTYTFGSQKIAVANDAVNGLTFTLNNGTVTKIEGLDRADGGDYVKVDITEGETTKTLYARRSGDVIEKVNGNWTATDIDISLYVVEYSADGNWTVKAVENNNEVTLTNVDYGVTDTALSINTNTPIVVINNSTSAIKVNDIDGIEKLDGYAIQIDNSGNFKVGTYDATDKSFTEGITAGGKTISTENFNVDNGKFTIDSSGNIKVTATEGTTKITAPKDASVFLESNGTFEVNGKTQVTISEKTGTEDIKIIFDDDGGISGIDTVGNFKITITDAPDDYADSPDLISKARYSTNRSYAFKNSALKVIVEGDDDRSVTFELSGGIPTNIEDVFAGNDAYYAATLTLKGTTMPNTLKINNADYLVTANGESLADGTVIRKNSTWDKWVSGKAKAQTNATYKVEIASDGEIVLKYKEGSEYKQTKNVKDYEAAFSSSTAPTEDDGTLPKYNGGVTLKNTISELVINPAGPSDYSINGKAIALSGETTIKSASGTFDSLELTLNSDRTVKYNNMTFSGNNAESKMTVPSSTSGTVTLDDKAKVTGVTASSSFSAKGDIVLDEITVKDIGSNFKTISGITTSGDTTGFTVDSKSLSVKNDAQYTVSAGSKYISGIKGGAELDGTFITGQNVSIATESIGDFKINNKSYVISGDGAVTINSDNGTVTKIDDLGASSSVTGDFSGNGIKINADDKIVKVTGDTDIGVVLNESSAISKIYNLSNNAVVANAGGATLLSTDGNGGKFQIGNDTYSLSAGTADFKSSGDTPNVTEIRNVSGGTSIVASQEETGLVIGNDTITVGNRDVTFEMGNGTVSGVTGVTGNVTGLSTGATVKVTSGSDLKINGSDVQITSTGDILAYAKTGAGYSSVTGIKNNSTITKATKDVVIIPDEAGTFIVGGHTIKTDSTPTFTMGSGNLVSAIGGVSGNVALYQEETGLKVLNDTINIKGAGDNDAVTLVAGNGNVNEIKNLKGDVNGLQAGAIAQVTKGDSAIAFNSATNNLQISDTDYTVRAASDGYDLVKGLSDGANVSTAKNASFVTDGTGTYTFKGHKFIINDDSEVTFETNADGNVSNISGVAYASIILNTLESGLSINGKAITVDASGGAVTINVNGNGGIEAIEGLKKNTNYSLPAGANLQVDATNTLTINGKSLQISGDNDVTVRATEDGYDLVTGLSNNANVTAGKDANFVTDKEGEFTFNGHKFNIDGDSQVTLTTSNADNFSVSAIDGVNGASIAVYSGESGLAVNGAKVTLGTPATNKASTLNVGANGNIIGVGGISAAGTYSLPSDITVGVETTGNVNINGSDLQIDDGGDDKYTVHSSSDGYDSVTGLTSGAVITKAKENSTLYSAGSTDSNETYTFDSKAFTAKGDATIGFVMGASNKLSAIGDFNGTIGGDFTDGVNVNNKNVNVSNDTAISVVGNGGSEGINKIAGLTNGATLNNAGGATTISTDNAGEFTFKTGNDNHKFSLSGTADFLAVQSTDYNPSITGIKNISNETILVYQDENSLIVGNNTVKLTGATSYAPVTLSMTSDTISGVQNLTDEISGLTTGATVKVTDDDVIINNVALKIDEVNGTDVVAKIGSKNYYSTVTGISNNATIKEAAEVSLVTDEAGTFIFGGTEGSQHKFVTSGDSEITFITDDNSNVTEIKGIDQTGALVAIYQDETFAINGRQIAVGGLGNYSGNSAVTLKFDGSGNITEVSNLTGSISNLSENVTVQVVDNDVTINNVALKINEATGTDFTVRSQAVGYNTVTGIDNDATISAAANVSIVANISNMTSTKHKFNFFADATATLEIVGDSDVTVATDNNSNINALGGFNGTLQSNQDNLQINGVNIYNTDDNISIIADSGVEHGISSVIGLSDSKEVSVATSGVSVSITPINASEITNFTINGTAYNLTGDNDGIVITDRVIKGLASDARLTIGAVGSYNVNDTELALTTEQTIAIGDGTKARLYNPNDIDFGVNTPDEDVIKQVFGTEATIEDSTIAPAVDNTDNDIYNITEDDGTVIISNTYNGKTINVSGNSDLLIVHNTANNVTINATGKSNTVVSSGSDIVVKGNDNTHVMPTSNHAVNYEGYDHFNNAGLQINNADIIAAVHDNAVQFNKDTAAITLSNNAVFNMSYAADKEGIVNFYNIQGDDMQKVGYTYDAKKEIDYSQGDKNILLRGNWNNGVTSSTLKGGSGNDTAFGGVDDYFDLGRGENFIEIKGGTGHATVAISDEAGETTVKGFDNSITDSDGDVVRVKFSETEAYYTNKGLMFVYKNDTLNVQDVATASDNTLYAYANVFLSNSENNQTVKASIARENEVIQVVANENAANEALTSAYIGHNSGVDFSDFNSASDLNINLNDGTGTLTGANQTITFRGITSVKGGKNYTTLIGSESDNNTLVAGKGAATIWGKGESDDLLIGDTDSSEVVTFQFDVGDGADTITNFKFTGDTTDRISLGSGISSLTHSGDDLVAVLSDKDSLTVKDGVGKTFTILSEGQTISAVTGSNLNYTGSSAYYNATDDNATLNIDSSTAVTEVIDLSEDKYSNNITFLDASENTGALTLSGGNNVDNTIKASSGGSSIYGGDGDSGNDLLIGSGGSDTFVCAFNIGNDTIAYGAGDLIHLSKTNTRSASALEIGGNGDVYTLSRGGRTLTVSLVGGISSESVVFKLSDGNLYYGFENMTKGDTTPPNASSDDLAYDYWSNELIDGEVTFWDGDGTSGDLATDSDNNYLTDEICIGNINFSIAPADTVYSFSDKGF